MNRAASPGELAQMTEAERAAYEEGRPFSFTPGGLRPIPGRRTAGAYIVQRPHEALRQTLLSMKTDMTEETT